MENKSRTERPKSKLKKRAEDEHDNESENEHDSIVVCETPEKFLDHKVQTKRDIVILATPPKLKLSGGLF